jgi:release factor glutamine methyltransferase
VKARPTVEALWRAGQARLRAARAPEPEADTRLLLAEAMGEPRLSLSLHGGHPVRREAEMRFEAMLARRLTGEPSGRILGYREFWGLRFGLAPETLEPRADSETLIEAALEALAPRRSEPLRFVDLGTGTGCLLVAMMSECVRASGLGVDRSENALRCARRNAEAAGVAGRCGWIASDWDAALDCRADLVISNPPYIATGDIPGLEEGVRHHDPALALDGGADGLEAYRRIAAALPRLIAPEGIAVLELGAGQRESVTGLCESAGLRIISCQRDLAGIERALVIASSPRRTAS